MYGIPAGFYTGEGNVAQGEPVGTDGFGAVVDQENEGSCENPQADKSKNKTDHDITYELTKSRRPHRYSAIPSTSITIACMPPHFRECCAQLRMDRPPRDGTERLLSAPAFFRYVASATPKGRCNACRVHYARQAADVQRPGSAAIP